MLSCRIGRMILERDVSARDQGLKGRINSIQSAGRENIKDIKATAAIERKWSLPLAFSGDLCLALGRMRAAKNRAV